MKYSIRNVIVVPSEEDKVKLVGRSVFAGDNIPELILNAQTGINRKTLMEIVGGNKPFIPTYAPTCAMSAPDASRPLPNPWPRCP